MESVTRTVLFSHVFLTVLKSGYCLSQSDTSAQHLAAREGMVTALRVTCDQPNLASGWMCLTLKGNKSSQGDEFNISKWCDSYSATKLLHNDLHLNILLLNQRDFRHEIIFPICPHSSSSSSYDTNSSKFFIGDIGSRLFCSYLHKHGGRKILSANVSEVLVPSWMCPGSDEEPIPSFAEERRGNDTCSEGSSDKNASLNIGIIGVLVFFVVVLFAGFVFVCFKYRRVMRNGRPLVVSSVTVPVGQAHSCFHDADGNV